jgi:hypothetical protein
LFWRSENEITEEFVKLFQRILRYQLTWTNDDFRIVSLEDATPKVYEKFFEDNERYPSVTIGGGGFTRTSQAINSMIGNFQHAITYFGTRGLALGLVDYEHTIAAAVPSDVLTTDILSGIEVYLIPFTLGQNEDSLNLHLYRNYQTTPTLISSASINKIQIAIYKNYYSEFYPQVTLTDSDYWVVFSTNTDNSYYIGIDTTVNNVFAYSGTRTSGSIHGSLYTPPAIRLGGAIEGTLTIRCADKNSTQRPREILDILANYTELLKQSQLTRNSGTNITTLALAGEAFTDEWLAKDIRIKNIRQGAGIERKRGENDTIFIFELIVEYYGEWHEDYTQDTLKDIEVELLPFTPIIYGE